MSTGYRGFTLIELVITLMILGILGVVTVPAYNSMIKKGKIGGAVADIAQIGQAVIKFQLIDGNLPDSLVEVNGIPRVDPWGNNYQYTNILAAKGKGKLRKNRNLVPINTLFDVYSKGEDGASVSPLTAKASRDDIVWANDGRFIGLASDY